MLEEKVKAILALPFPETIKKAQEILGMFNYYHLFIEFYAWIITSLYEGLRKGKEESSHPNSQERMKITWMK